MDNDRHLSNLSCYACKRRKVRCNRTLPACSLCAKHEGTCQYPTSSKRPGPKLGSTQKKRRGVSIASLVSPASHPTPMNTTSYSLGLSPEAQRIDPALRPAHPGHGLRSRAPRRSSVWSTEEPQMPSPSSVASSRRPVLDHPEDCSAAPDISQMMYPSHETQTRPQTPSQSHDSPDQCTSVSGITVDTICRGLQISRSVYHYLMKIYFSNMTSFTLFKPNGIESKFASMRSQVEAEALVATIFAFSARFHPGDKDPDRVAECPTPSYFAKIASGQLTTALDSYEDTTPPFHLLQASVLDAFYHISKSVRSRSWRILGNAIRLAYDMKLHLLDVQSNRDSHGETVAPDIERWSFLEERRRAWWALWEMDVFASTIRRLPLAMDWTQNFTLLPAPDRCWFEGVYQESCFLSVDPGNRWKQMSQVGNTSARAWFIVINSLMHDTQLLVYNPPASGTTLESKKDGLAIIANALYCVTSSMPAELAYDGQVLDFQTKASPRDISCRQFHCDVYSVHLMTQLVRFMIDHHVVCAQVAATARAHANDESRPSDSPSWSNYMKAAENIVTIVRSSSHDHFKYVNPFLSNTLWFAAASQIACKVVGPSSRAEALAASNYDLLALTIQRYISFWCSADILRPRLERIETALQSLMVKDKQPAARSGSPHDTEDTTRLARANCPPASSQPPSQAPANVPSFHPGLAMAGAPAVDTDHSSFMDMFPGNDASGLPHQVMFDDLEHFLPYGVDELWTSQRVMSAW